MPISRVPKLVNKQAIKQCYIWKTEAVENANFLLFNGESLGKRRGNAYSCPTINRDFDLFSHNHPSYNIDGKKVVGSPINASDCLELINKNGVKAFAATEEGFTSMDFSRSNLSKKDTITVLKKAINETNKTVEKEILPKYKNKKITLEEMMNTCNDYLENMNKSLAKKYHWTYSNVKWSDYKK